MTDPVFGKDLSFYLLELPFYERIVGLLITLVVITIVAWARGRRSALSPAGSAPGWRCPGRSAPSTRPGRRRPRPMSRPGRREGPRRAARRLGPLARAGVRAGARCSALVARFSASSPAITWSSTGIRPSSPARPGSTSISGCRPTRCHRRLGRRRRRPGGRGGHAALARAGSSPAARIGRRRWSFSGPSILPPRSSRRRSSGSMSAPIRSPSNSLTSCAASPARGRPTGLQGPDVEEQDFAVSATPLTRDDLDKSAATLRDARIWDWRALEPQLQQTQGLRPYYTFSGVDIDRYLIDGVERQVMITARELDVEQAAAAGAGVGEPGAEVHPRLRRRRGAGQRDRRAGQPGALGARYSDPGQGRPRGDARRNLLRPADATTGSTSTPPKRNSTSRAATRTPRPSTAARAAFPCRTSGASSSSPTSSTACGCSSPTTSRLRAGS